MNLINSLQIFLITWANSSGFYLTWLQGSCELLVKNNCNMFYCPNFLVNLDSTSSNTRVILWEYFGSNVNDISLKNKQKFRQTQNPTEKETTLVNSKIHTQTTIAARVTIIINLWFPRNISILFWAGFLLFYSTRK